MPEGPKISYTSKDLTINSSQINVMFDEHFKSWHWTILALEKDGFDAEHPLFICFVAEVNGNVVGYSISYYTYSTWCGKAMYLEDRSLCNIHLSRETYW